MSCEKVSIAYDNYISNLKGYIRSRNDDTLIFFWKNNKIDEANNFIEKYLNKKTSSLYLIGPLENFLINYLITVKDSYEDVITISLFNLKKETIFLNILHKYSFENFFNIELDEKDDYDYINWLQDISNETKEQNKNIISLFVKNEKFFNELIDDWIITNDYRLNEVLNRILKEKKKYLENNIKITTNTKTFKL